MAEPPDGPPGEEAEAAEHELRVLLARTVPNLPTPLDRMGQVKERVRRRRRRHRALGAVLAVTAFAGGGLLLPEALTGGDRDTRPMVAESSERDSAPVTPAAPRRLQKTVTHPDLAGMELSVPVEWQSLNMATTGEPQLGDTTTYLSTAPLTPYTRPCTEKSVCTPVRRLPSDGLLASFSLARHVAPNEKLRLHGKPLTRSEEPLLSCEWIGGAYGYTGAIGGLPGGDGPIYVSVCAGPDVPESRVREVDEFMARAVFRGTGKTTYGRDTPTGDAATRAPDRSGQRRGIL
ncbi:hypothetical protein [Streptomyces qinzhouensis]|uniref:Uncharacterized protein n=1 Tax=Streptomyces qinzhouensis TaxID=2599401 RepID=A0A5B8J8F5_9ACTN|nr:hypothetical protein [Streptomyces qinzhouensis]QDY77556.1 hypothetical protein FQU76_14640 [Streptomyces qinzhouensis]